MFSHYATFRISTKAIIFNESHSAILLIKSNPNKRGENVYGLPGGHIESTDGSPEAGLLRELREEIAPRVEILSLLLKASFFYGKKRLILAYVAIINERDVVFYETNKNEDGDTPVWLPLKEIDTIEIAPQYLSEIRSLL